MFVYVTMCTYKASCVNQGYQEDFKGLGHAQGLEMRPSHECYSL